MYSTGVFSSVGLELVIEWKQNCRKKKKEKRKKRKRKKKRKPQTSTVYTVERRKHE